MSILNQTGAVVAMNIRSIPQRVWMSLATIIAIALVVAVLLGFTALANGFSKTMSGSGSKDIAIVLRDGSESELNSVISNDQINILAEAPGVARDANGRPRISNELYVVVDGIKKATGSKANMPLRGLGAEGLAVRKQARIRQGRMFTPGSDEIVVGAGLLREFSGFELNKSIRLGGKTWTVVGVFEAPGTVFESELWADTAVVQSLFNRGTSVQTSRVVLTGEAALPAFQKFVKGDPRLQLSAESEQAYYAKQAERSGFIVRFIGYPLALFMAVGALAGALNTMFSSVSSRAAEIATLRIIGFSGFSAFVGTMAEALMLSAIGALVGTGIVALFFNGMSASTLGSSFTQVSFRLQLGPELVVQALVLALVIGFIGGFFPGWRAARQKPLVALSSQ